MTETINTSQQCYYTKLFSISVTNMPHLNDPVINPHSHQTQITQKEGITMQSISLSNQEIKILQTLIAYGAVNDANTFVADDLIITDDQAKKAILQLQKRFNHLADNPKKED